MTPTEDLERLAASITPGRWRKYGKMTGKVISEGPEVGTVEICETGDFLDEDLVPFNADRWNADADAIALLPELLAEVIAARKATPTESLLDGAWKSGFNAGFGEAWLTKSPTVEAAANVLLDSGEDLSQLHETVEDIHYNGGSFPHAINSALRALADKGGQHE